MQRTYLAIVRVSSDGTVKLSEPVVREIGCSPGSDLALFFTRGGVVGFPKVYMHPDTRSRLSAAFRAMGMRTGFPELVKWRRRMKQALRQEP